MSYPTFNNNALLPSPVDPAFLLGTSPMLGNGNATYHAGAAAAGAMFSSTGAYSGIDPVIGSARAPASLLVWPMLWGPGQRGLLLLPPQNPI